MTMLDNPPGEKRTWQEELKATGEGFVERIEELVKEGNVRRIIVRHGGHTILEVPVMIGVVGALLAPQVAILGALAAVLTECTVVVEREAPPPSQEPGGAAETTATAPAESTAITDAPTRELSTGEELEAEAKATGLAL